MAMIDAYLEHLRISRDPSRHTLAAYRADLRDHLSFLTGRPEDEPLTDAIMAYISALVDRRAAARPIRRRVACLRGYYRDLVRRKVLVESPFIRLELQLPRARGLPRAIPRREAKLLAVAAWQNCRGNRSATSVPAFAVAVLVLISSGVRVGEACGAAAICIASVGAGKAQFNAQTDIPCMIANTFAVSGGRKVWPQMRREGFVIARRTIELLKRDFGLVRG